MFIEEVIKRRKELKMTQQELAQKIGVRRSTISDFESGKRELGSGKMELLFNVLDLVLYQKSEIHKVELWDMTESVVLQLKDKSREEVKKLSQEKMYELINSLEIKEISEEEAYNLFWTIVCFKHTLLKSTKKE